MIDKTTLKIKIYIRNESANAFQEEILKGLLSPINFFLARTVIVGSLLLVPAFAASNSSSVGKVRYTLGEVTVQKKAKTNWNPLRIGLKVREQDLIRTLVESEAGIALSDGSSITIEENTTILFENAVNQQKGSTKTVEIRTGRVFFDVQKQKADNQFQFKTGTATAAIRGTNGFIEGSSSGTIVSLETGKMLVTDSSGQSIELNAGETLVQERGKPMRKFKTSLAGSKSLAKEISKEKANHTFSAENLEKRAEELVTESLRIQNPCKFQAIPSFVTSPEVHVAGKCSDSVQVRVSGIEAALSDSGTFDVPVTWDAESFGSKRIRVKCSKGNAEVLCHEANVEYTQKTSNDDSAFVRIRKDRAVSMNSINGLTIDADFFSEDSNATVTVSLGSITSPNLNSAEANGHASFTISPQNPDLKWTEEFAVVTLKSQKKTLHDTIPVSFPPKLSIIGASADQCEIRYSLVGTHNSKVVVEEFVDGMPAYKTEHTTDVPSASLPMLKGKRRYRILVEDSKGNRSEISDTFHCNL